MITAIAPVVQTSKVRKSSKCPITVDYRGKLDRVVVYRVVKILEFKVCFNHGFQYGLVSIDETKWIVVRHIQGNGEYSQWELVH